MDADLTGVVLDGRYRVIEPISEGAMGVVYRAERVKLGRIVAIKVLHDQLPAELSSRKRFETEATAMAKLEHPHCAAVIDVGVHEDKPFVVMDYVSGENLREVVAAGPVPLPRAVEIVRQTLSGLAHAHEHGIIHRDIKPANIVLSQKAGLGDHVKILDFGLARITDAPKVTTGIVVGTPAYMAPEQIRGTAIDHRADLYACGVLLFELLTGKKPFVSAKDDPVEVCSMHLKIAPPTLSAMQPGIDFGELEGIVGKALAKKADDRYATAMEFAAALDQAVPRRVSSPPSQPIPVASVASESGWAVPADAKSSIVPSAPVTAPVVVVDTGPTAPAPVPVPAPVAPRPPPRPTGKQPPGPFRAKRASEKFDPKVALASAAAVVEAVEEGKPPAENKGLPPDFDLSRAIPSPDAATKLGLVAVTERSEPIKEIAPVSHDATAMFSGVPPKPDPNATAVFAGAPVDLKESAPAPVDHSATAMFQGAPPAGPSPLAAADVPAMDPVSLPTPPAFRDYPVSKKQFQIVGIVIAAIVLIAIIVGLTRGSKDSTPAKKEDPVAAPKLEGADAPLAKAAELADAGNKKEAIEQLAAARTEFPKDARVAYQLGILYFATKQGSLGLKQFRETLELDGTYRADPDLIKAVLGAFNSATEYPAELGAFLRNDIGPPVRQYLEETAATHPSTKVRNRAKAELAKL